MGYAVELFIDHPHAGDIIESMKSLGSPMIPLGSHPHLSLAVFDEVDLTELEKITRIFASRIHAFTINLSSIGIFPGQSNIIFLAPVVTTALLDLHREFHQLLENAGLKCDSLYKTDRWEPHCTITFDADVSQTAEAVDLLRRSHHFGDCRISSIHLVEFRPVVDIASFALLEAPIGNNEALPV